MKLISLLGLILIGGLGCVPGPKSGKGFSLPDGDVAKGRETYINLQCNACHQLEGVDQLKAEGAQPELSVALGGEVARIKTYGELVTSIINPSHKIATGLPLEAVSADGQSKMRIYNDVLTVTQLSDLVSFLQSKYELQEYDATDYPSYYYGM